MERGEGSDGDRGRGGGAPQQGPQPDPGLRRRAAQGVGEGATYNGAAVTLRCVRGDAAGAVRASAELGHCFAPGGRAWWRDGRTVAHLLRLLAGCGSTRAGGRIVAPWLVAALLVGVGVWDLSRCGAGPVGGGKRGVWRRRGGLVGTSGGESERRRRCGFQRLCTSTGAPPTKPGVCIYRSPRRAALRSGRAGARKNRPVVRRALRLLD